jgi:YbbR domain-containing protein
VRLRPRHPLLFLLALLIAYMLWYSLGGQRRERTAVRGFKAPLTLVNLPRDLVITTSVPDTVAVQLRGPLNVTGDPSMPLEVLLDLSDARSGVHTYPIIEGDIQTHPEVTVVSVDPAAITLELERLETITLPVRPTVEGTPAPGFAISEVRVAPAQLAIQGPGSLLTALEDVETSPVSVEGAVGSVEATVQPKLPHPMLRSLTAVPLLVVVELMPTPAATPTPSGGR